MKPIEKSNGLLSEELIDLLLLQALLVAII